MINQLQVQSTYTDNFGHPYTWTPYVTSRKSSKVNPPTDNIHSFPMPSRKRTEIIFLWLSWWFCSDLSIAQLLRFCCLRYIRFGVESWDSSWVNTRYLYKSYTRHICLYFILIWMTIAITRYANPWVEYFRVEYFRMIYCGPTIFSTSRIMTLKIEMLIAANYCTMIVSYV